MLAYFEGQDVVTCLSAFRQLTTSSLIEDNLAILDHSGNSAARLHRNLYMNLVIT